MRRVWRRGPQVSVYVSVRECACASHARTLTAHTRVRRRTFDTCNLVAKEARNIPLLAAWCAYQTACV